MVDFSLNSNIKKNLTKTAVSAKQNGTKAQEAVKTAEVKTSAKTTVKQVVSDLTSGTASVSKTVETLKNNFKTEVNATKADNKTTLTTKVDNKDLTITTNAKDVSKASIDDKSISTVVKDFTAVYNACKGVLTGISKEEFKPFYNVMLALANKNIPDEKSLMKTVELVNKIGPEKIAENFEDLYNTEGPERRNAPFRKSSSSGSSQGGGKTNGSKSGNTGKPAVGKRGEHGGKSWVDYYNEFCDTWKKATGNKNITGQNFFQEDFLGYKAGDPMPMTNMGGACCNSGSQGASVAGLGMVYATFKGLKDGEVKAALIKSGAEALHNAKDATKNNGSTLDWSNLDWNKIVPPTTRPTTRPNGNSVITPGYVQYGSHTVDTGNGSYVDFESWTMTSLEDDTGTYAIGTNSKGQAVIYGGAIKNPDKGKVTQNPDGSITTTYNDGSSETRCQNEDGSVTVTTRDENGNIIYSVTTSKQQNDDGSTTITYPNGATVTTSADGKTTVTKDKDGNVTSVVHENDDGTITETKKNEQGETIITITGQTDADGHAQTTEYNTNTGTTTVTIYTSNDGTANGVPATITTTTDSNGNTHTTVTTTDSNGNTVTIWVDEDGVTHTEYEDNGGGGDGSEGGSGGGGSGLGGVFLDDLFGGNHFNFDAWVAYAQADADAWINNKNAGKNATSFQHSNDNFNDNY